MTVKGIDTDATEEEVVVPNDQQDLIEGLLSDEPVEEEVQEEEEVVEEKPEEKPEEVEEEKPEPEEEPEVEEAEVEEEVEEKPSEEEEEDEVTDETPEQVLIDANEKLRDQIIAMAEQDFGVKSPDDVEEEPSEEEEKPEETEKPEPIKLEELKIEDFLNEDELDRVNDHPELLNVAFGRAMKAMLEQVSSALSVIGPLEQEVKALPKQVSEAVGEQLNFSTFINSFYDDNPDLKGKPSKVVHMTYKSLATDARKEGKKTTLGELYNQAGDEVREMLSIPKVAAKPGERKPALPGAKTPKRIQKTPKTSSEAKTQAELREFLASPD
jgi:hypothetical protein